MIKIRLTLLLMILACGSAAAQFVTQGRIEYEKKSNLHKLWEDNEWMEGFKDKIKPFAVWYFNMAFTESMSKYSPGREGEVPKMTWGLPPGGDNEVVQDYGKKMVTANKNIYEEHFLIKDTARKLKWRLGSEVRTIAGYTCRKAVARICD